MTSPAHTPVSFLDGGAAGMFSARCLDALARAGFDPKDFGSYDYVAGEIQKAKKRVALFNDMKYGCPANASADRRRRYEQCQQLQEDMRRGAPPAGANRGRIRRFNAQQASGGRVPPVPSARERKLSGSQSGHLVMNSSYQRDRGNPCSSVVDGFEDNLAPCMPHDDSTAVAGRGHHWVYHYEIAQPAARGLEREGSTAPTGQSPPVGSSRYPADQIARDEDWRIRNAPFIREEDISSSPLGRPAAANAGGGASASTTAPGALAGSGAGATPSSSTDTETPKWQQEIDGETAADCIVAFKDAAMAAMKQKCKDEVADNELAASGGNAHLTPDQYQQGLRDEIADPSTSEDRRKEATSRLRAAEQAGCRAAAGRRIGTPAQQNDARCPAGSRATTHERCWGDSCPINLHNPDQYPDPPVD